MKPTSRRRPNLRARSRGGSILLEFALVSIVLYVMLAGMLSFGRMYYSIQTAQMAADMAARELSRMPLAATSTFEQVRDNPLSDFSTRIYSDTALQLAAYRYSTHYLDDDGAAVPMSPVDWCGVIHIRADGYSVVEMRADEYVLRRMRYVAALARARDKMDSWVSDALSAPAVSA